MPLLDGLLPLACSKAPSHNHPFLLLYFPGMHFIFSLIISQLVLPAERCCNIGRGKLKVGRNSSNNVSVMRQGKDKYGIGSLNNIM